MLFRSNSKKIILFKLSLKLRLDSVIMKLNSVLFRGKLNCEKSLGSLLFLSKALSSRPVNVDFEISEILSITWKLFRIHDCNFLKNRPLP